MGSDIYNYGWVGRGGVGWIEIEILILFILVYYFFKGTFWKSIFFVGGLVSWRWVFIVYVWDLGGLGGV